MNKRVLTDEQIDIFKEVGIARIATSSKAGVPHCTTIQPSRISHNEIIIPIIQMVRTVNNIKENPNAFLLYYKEDPNDYENNTQFKINATAKIYESGKLFKEIKEYEERENLPEGFYVNGIVVLTLKDVEVCVG